MKTYKMQPLNRDMATTSYYAILTKLEQNTRKLRAFERAVSGGGIFNISNDGAVT